MTLPSNPLISEIGQRRLILVVPALLMLQHLDFHETSAAVGSAHRNGYVSQNGGL
jgi:hypothetical protein